MWNVDVQSDVVKLLKHIWEDERWTKENCKWYYSEKLDNIEQCTLQNTISAEKLQSPNGLFTLPDPDSDSDSDSDSKPFG